MGIFVLQVETLKGKNFMCTLKVKVRLGVAEKTG